MIPKFQRIETRTWFEDGKYAGNKAQWQTVDRTIIEQEKTGDFYGDWQGTRHFDGASIVAADIARAIGTHASPVWGCRSGEVTHCAMPRGDWGEWRIVTVVKD